MHFPITRKPRDGFCSNFLRSITNMVHIYCKYSAELEIVARDIFEIFGLTTQKPLAGFCSNFQVVIISMLYTLTVVCAHTPTHAQSHSRIVTLECTYPCSHLQALALSRSHIRTHARTCAYIHTNTRTSVCMHSHAITIAHTCT